MDDLIKVLYADVFDAHPTLTPADIKRRLKYSGASFIVDDRADGSVVCSLFAPAGAVLRINADQCGAVEIKTFGNGRFYPDELQSALNVVDHRIKYNAQKQQGATFTA